MATGGWVGVAVAVFVGVSVVVSVGVSVGVSVAICPKPWGGAIKRKAEQKRKAAKPIGSD
jgi:hypothetical protein